MLGFSPLSTAPLGSLGTNAQVEIFWLEIVPSSGGNIVLVGGDSNQVNNSSTVAVTVDAGAVTLVAANADQVATSSTIVVTPTYILAALPGSQANSSGTIEVLKVVSLVQKRSVYPGTSLATLSNVTAGNLLVVASMSYGTVTGSYSTTNPKISDSQGLSWYPVGLAGFDPAGAGAPSEIAAWWAMVPTTSAITVTIGNPGGDAGVHIWELNGSGTAVIDATFVSSTGTGTVNITTNSYGATVFAFGSNETGTFFGATCTLTGSDAIEKQASHTSGTGIFLNTGIAGAKSATWIESGGSYANTIVAATAFKFGAAHALTTTNIIETAFSGTGAITRALTLVGSSASQTATSSADAVTLGYGPLVTASNTQDANSGTGVITQNQILTGSSAVQGAACTTGAITRTQTLVSAANNQAATATTVSISRTLSLVASNASQSSTSSTVVNTQNQILAGSPGSQANSSSTIVIARSINLVAAANSSAALSTSIVIARSLTLTAANSNQYADSPGVTTIPPYTPSLKQYIGGRTYSFEALARNNVYSPEARNYSFTPAARNNPGAPASRTNTYSPATRTNEYVPADRNNEFSPSERNNYLITSDRTGT